MGSGGVGASRDGERLKKSMTRSLSAGLVSAGLASAGSSLEAFSRTSWNQPLLLWASPSAVARGGVSGRPRRGVILDARDGVVERAELPVDILSSQWLLRQTLGKRLPRAIVNLLARFWRRFRELRHGPGQQIVKISHDARPFSGRMTTSPSETCGLDSP